MMVEILQFVYLMDVYIIEVFSKFSKKKKYLGKLFIYCTEKWKKKLYKSQNFYNHKPIFFLHCQQPNLTILKLQIENLNLYRHLKNNYRKQKKKQMNYVQQMKY